MIDRHFSFQRRAVLQRKIKPLCPQATVAPWFPSGRRRRGAVGQGEVWRWLRLSLAHCLPALPHYLPSPPNPEWAYPASPHQESLCSSPGGGSAMCEQLRVGENKESGQEEGVLLETEVGILLSSWAAELILMSPQGNTVFWNYYLIWEKLKLSFYCSTLSFLWSLKWENKNTVIVNVSLIPFSRTDLTIIFITSHN